MSTRQFSGLLAVIAAAELTAEILSHRLLIYLTKPLLMLAIAGFYMSKVDWQNSLFHKMMLSAFGFSWLGDVLLMLVDISGLFFTGGLVAFLVAHLFYIGAFGHNVKYSPNPSFLKRKPQVGIPVFLVFALLLYYLIPVLDEMLVPVILYTSVITMMVLAALNRYKAAPPDSVSLILAGSLLFMASDSLIAIDKFLTSIGGARVLIMSSYIVAQYFIAIGGMRYKPQHSM